MTTTEAHVSMNSTIVNAVDKKEVFLVATKAVVLRADGKMLVMLRGKDAPTNPLGWDLPGGILDHGEEADRGVIRETKEETGLDIETPRVFYAIARINNIGEHWTTIYYVAPAPETDIQISWEHDEFKWIRPEELAEMPGSSRNKEAVAYFISLRDSGKL